MNRRNLSISVLIVLALGLLLIPAAQAAPDCTAGPGPGIDWSGCDKTNQDFTNADLSDMILVGTDFTGSTFDNTNLSGSDARGAIMRDMGTGSGVIGPINLNGAQVNGLDLSGNTTIVFATFFGASGTPILPEVPPATIFLQCPGGNLANYVDSFCSWVPTAVSLQGLSGASAVEPLPFAAVASLGLISAVFVAGSRTREEEAAV